MEDLPSYAEFRSEGIMRRGIEKTVELVADEIINVALMLISHKGLAKPDSSREAIALLEGENILKKSISSRIQDLVSFRNLLVHRYGRIQAKEEYENIQENHKDILAFVKAVEKYLKEQ